MNHAIETRPVRPLFFSYLFPAMAGLLLMSVNILFDGIFVSHGVGTAALAGINIAVPIFSVLLSISLWIGTGGATLFSIAQGEGDRAKANRIFTLSFVSILLIVCAIIALLLPNLRSVAFLFGADEVTYPYVKDYLQVILSFGLFFAVENMLSIFVRNDGNPALSMAGLMTTAVLNILLNYVFIFILDYGVLGCAFATALSTVVGMLVLCLHFFRKSSTIRFAKSFYRRQTLRDIFTIGLPSFLVEGSLAVIIILFNISFLHYMGTDGVTAYAMVNYIHAVLLTGFLGIGMALQPLASYHHGARLGDRLLQLLKIGLLTGIGFGLLTTAAAVFFPDKLILLFGDEEPRIEAIAIKGFAIFALGYVFLAVNMVFAEFFQSVEKVGLALTVVLLRSLVLFIPILICFPVWFGPAGIWWVFPASEAITAVCISLYVGLRFRRNFRTRRQGAPQRAAAGQQP